MEASERPELPFDEPATGGVVRALDDRIVIEALTVADERAAHLVRERQQVGRPAADTVRKAIEIGARVLDSEETAANVDYVRRELEAGLGQLDRKLGGTLEEGAEELAERIATTFGADRGDVRCGSHRLGPGADQGDRGRREPTPARGAPERPERRGRDEPPRRLAGSDRQEAG